MADPRNPRRACILAEEAVLAALTGKAEVALYLQERSFEWMNGTAARPGTVGPTGAPQQGPPAT